MRPTNKAAVDEGRNPYGTPGQGNGDDVWRRLTAIPCPTCGATRKRLLIEGDRTTIRCSDEERT